jgi:hypothetical protein
MSRGINWQFASVLVLQAALVAQAPRVAAQQALTASVLRGDAAAARNLTTTLSPGQRVENTGSWTEIVFSDGSSVALERGADFVAQRMNRVDGGAVVQGAISRGRVRVAAADGTRFLLQVGDAQIEVESAAVVIVAGPGGSVTMISGRRAVLSQNGTVTVLRRPGYTVAFDSRSPERRSGTELTAMLDPFAPAAGGQTANGRLQDGTILAGFSDPKSAQGVIRTTAQVLPPGEPGGGVGTPSGPGQPPSRVGGGFGLAEGRLRGGFVLGSDIGAPGVNSGTSVVAANVSVTDAEGQEGGLTVRGISAIDKQGTARIRRFPPAAASGPTGVRNDSGVIAPRSSSILLPGQPATGVAGAYFIDLANQSLPKGRTQTFYDAIGNVGINTLTVFDANGGPPDLGLTVSVPRYYVADASPPTLSSFPAAYSVELVGPTSGTPVAQKSALGLSRFTPPQLYGISPSGTIYVERFVLGDFGQDPRLYRFDPASGKEILVVPPPARVSPDNPNAFRPDQVLLYVQAQAAGSAAPTYLAQSLFQLPTQQLVIHQPAAVFEIELQQRSNPSTPAPGPAQGVIFALTNTRGLAFQAGGQDLPGVLTQPANISLVLPNSGQTTNGVDVVSDDGGQTFHQAPGDSKPPVNPTAHQPAVFIIDKITASSDRIFNERGIESGERFFVIGGAALPAPADGGLPGPGGSLPAGSVTRFAISDGLNPDGNWALGKSIAQQFLGPGDPNQPVPFNAFNAFRPEETFVGALTAGVPRGDTHLLVITGTGDRNPAMRSDIEVAADGRTSASIAVGGIARLPLGDRSLALSGALVGSTRVAGTNAGSTAITSNLGSLGTDATAVGAHLFGGTTDPATTGQVGFFAISQADTRLGAPGTEAGVQPGRLDNLGSATAPDAFGYTRLATNVGAPDLGTARGLLGGDPAGIAGFAAGLVEALPAGGTSISVYAAVGANLGDVVISSRNDGRELDATFRLAPRAAGEIAATPPAAPPPAGRATRTLSFGGDGTSGAPPKTAVASQGMFAAVIPGQAAMASVDADLLKGIRRPDGTPTALSPSNEHVAWGYFLGDLVPTTPGGAREYANLGFWVAGRPVDAGTLQTLTGTATYQGGMIGNAIDARGLRTVAGDFAHTFDFGRRTGRFDAQFDGAAFSVGTTMGAGSNSFGGSAGGSAGRTLSAQGAFFHNAATGGPVNVGNLPRATGGTFGVIGPNYGANGIFVGARR